MSGKYVRVVLSVVVVVGMLSMFALPAAAQEAPEPDPEEGIEGSGSVDAANQAGRLLLDAFGVTVISIDCEFDADNPQESCDVVVLDNDVPPGDAPGLPSPPVLPTP
jgi:hypothetical protein